MFFPRNADSKKAIPLPKDFDKEIADLFFKEFKGNLKDNQTLEVKNTLYKNELMCSLYLKTTGQLKQQIFEVSIDYEVLAIENNDYEQSEIKKQAENIQNQISFIVDYLALCLDTFLIENKTPSSEWTKIDFQKQILFVRHHTSNLELEEQANKLLGEDFLEDLSE